MPTIDIWDKMQIEFEKSVYKRTGKKLGLVGLIIGIIISGGKERDLTYLGSDPFLYHCYLVGLNSDFVTYWFERAWKEEKQYEELSNAN